MVVLRMPRRSIPCFGPATMEEIGVLGEDINWEINERAMRIKSLTTKIAALELFLQQCANHTIPDRDIRVDDVIWTGQQVCLVRENDIEDEYEVDAIKALGPHGFYGPAAKRECRHATPDERDSVKAQLEKLAAEFRRSLAEHIAEHDYWQKIKSTKWF